MTTEQLRDRFVASDLFVQGAIRTLYSHEDRIVIGGVVPRIGQPLTLPTYDPLRSETFCERRELGIVAVGGAGVVVVDGTTHVMAHYDVLYVGMGARDIMFSSANTDESAAFYLVSALSHVSHPTRLVRVADAQSTAAGTATGANQRVITKYIHADGLQSSQLVLGITALEPGSVWNTMPCHLTTGGRRSTCTSACPRKHGSSTSSASPTGRAAWCWPTGPRSSHPGGRCTLALAPRATRSCGRWQARTSPSRTWTRSR